MFLYFVEKNTYSAIKAKNVGFLIHSFQAFYVLFHYSVLHKEGSNNSKSILLQSHLRSLIILSPFSGPLLFLLNDFQVPPVTF